MIQCDNATIDELWRVQIGDFIPFFISDNEKIRIWKSWFCSNL